MASVRTFSLTPKAPGDEKFRGQQLLIIQFLRAHPGSTIPEIGKGIEDKLETRQTADRVTSFYMSTWKRKGWVAEAQAQREGDEPAGNPGGEAHPSEEPEANIDPDASESTGASPEERLHAASEADLEATSAQFDRQMKVSDAVVKGLGMVDEPMTPAQLVTLLESQGYTCQLTQAQGALNNLIRRGEVRKNSQGAYELKGVRA